MNDAMETNNQEALDDRGTNQEMGREILKRLRDQGFDASDEKLAVALGRPLEEVRAWMADAQEPVDDDIVMKARGIAKQRNIEIE